MTIMKNHLEDTLLGRRQDTPLRTVGGYNWLQHLGMAAIFDDRKDLAGAWHHSRSAARSFVASLQLLSRPGGRQFFHLSGPSVYDAVERYMLPTHTPHYALFQNVFERFKVEADQLMSHIEPSMTRLCALEDFSMLSNVYLNAVERMADGVGVYFVHDRANPAFTDIAVHAPNGIRRFLGAMKGAEGSQTMSDVTAYYAILISQRQAGNVELYPEELERIESTLTALVEGVRDEGDSGSLAQSLEAFEAAEPPRRLAFGM